MPDSDDAASTRSSSPIEPVPPTATTPPFRESVDVRYRLTLKTFEPFVAGPVAVEGSPPPGPSVDEFDEVVVGIDAKKKRSRGSTTRCCTGAGNWNVVNKLAGLVLRSQICCQNQS